MQETDNKLASDGLRVVRSKEHWEEASSPKLVS